MLQRAHEDSRDFDGNVLVQRTYGLQTADYVCTMQLLGTFLTRLETLESRYASFLPQAYILWLVHKSCCHSHCRRMKFNAKCIDVISRY